MSKKLAKLGLMFAALSLGAVQAQAARVEKMVCKLNQTVRHSDIGAGRLLPGSSPGSELALATWEI